MKILVINGVNMNMLGKRQPDIYGNQTLDDMNTKIGEQCPTAALDFFQSNFEGEIVEMLHHAMDEYDGVVLNAGAHTHYSHAIADAIASIPTPVIEVHISNVFARDAHRHTSVLAPFCQGVISGFGMQSYVLAIQALQSHNENI